MMNLHNLEQTCFSCPSQWEAVTDDGADVYIRYRHGTLTVHVEGSLEHIEDIGSDLDGSMSTSEMLARLKRAGLTN